VTCCKRGIGPNAKCRSRAIAKNGSPSVGTNEETSGRRAEPLRVRGRSRAPDRIADEISRCLEADYVVVTAGRFDIVVEVVMAGRRKLLDLTNRMRAIDGVVSTGTFVYLEMWKQLYDWGMRGDAQPS
jgi:Lrp/AsnC ligand binding domain